MTNDWIVQFLKFQKKFSSRYSYVQTKVLMLSPERNYFSYNRAMKYFVEKAFSSKLFVVPLSLHHILFERDEIKIAAMKIISKYLNQSTDDLSLIEPEVREILQRLISHMIWIGYVLLTPVGTVSCSGKECINLFIW
jgi:hypothetical protein